MPQKVQDRYNAASLRSRRGCWAAATRPKRYTGQLSTRTPQPAALAFAQRACQRIRAFVEMLVAAVEQGSAWSAARRMLDRGGSATVRWSPSDA